MASRAENRDLDAAERALGLVPRGRESARDEELREAWEMRLAGLAAVIPPVEPPPGLFRGIEDQIALEATVASLDEERAKRRAWRGRTWVATAIAAGLGGVIALAPPTLDRLPAPVEDGVRQVAAAVGVDLPEATAPATGAEAFTRLVALVTADDNPALTGMVVQFDPATGTVTIVPSLIDPPAGRSFELWHLEAGGDTPRSLGLFPGGPVVINASAGPGDTFAISEEPEGGSPDGSPTLPLFHGTMTVAN